MELAEVTVGAVAHGGHFVARDQGRVIFVRHALPGERVRVALREAAEGDRFWRGDVVEVLESAAARREHFWPVADSLKAYSDGVLPVGGAEFGHIDRSFQRELKQLVLTEQLQRLAGLERVTEVEEVPGESADGLAWRSRTGFAVTPDGRLGMHAHRSHQVVAVQDMPLAVSGIRELSFWDLDFSGLERVEVAAPTSGDGPLVLLAGAKAAANRVAVELPEEVSAAHWDPERSRVSALRGRPWLREEALGREFRVSGDGFWQIHRKAPETLGGAVRGMLEGFLRPGARVADLYAGAGLFSGLLADAVGVTGEVLSVEGSPVTSKDAVRNFDGEPQVLVRPGRVERVLAAAARSGSAGSQLDAVVLDPPRAGAGKNVVRQIVASGPRAVAYVSCDPASFARDVGYFAAAGWQLAELRAFDLYPHTHHLETVALLVPGT
ncbi:class I SAM-dependent RNA methyltransferase [Psychromicrobium lacuslunae]|uniref:SAM-dependent methyltransferase n=1 Tax=Psychromicrobium lacuslunae TaxID=1618207 RepID=A0A0D4BXD9_9MICC|nr:TRAM domain-containing protein [Psychromicrobium lacuslunae]AJT40781.1 SAM-dependent methyltransferase [Psychromicrobium lacuslunae]